MVKKPRLVHNKKQTKATEADDLLCIQSDLNLTDLNFTYFVVLTEFYSWYCSQSRFDVFLPADRKQIEIGLYYINLQ